MDFTSARRPTAKYGKNAKRVLVHDFFEQPSERADTKPASRLPISPSSPGDIHPLQEEDSDPIVATRAIRPAHVTSHSSASVSHGSPSRSPSPSKQPSDSAGADLSLYDMDSSDDDLGSRSLKRRKLVQHTQKAITQRPFPVAKLKQKSENLPLKATQQIEHRSRKEEIMSNGTKELPKLQKAAQNTQNNEGPPRTEPQHGAHRTKLDKSIPSQIRLQPSPGLLQNAAEKDTEMRETSILSDSASHHSDNSAISVSSHNKTPKRKRPASRASDAPVPSPSQLGLTDLRLTPERSPRQNPKELQHKSPHRGRRRLVDRLDAPTQSGSSANPSRTTSVDTSESPKLNQRHLVSNFKEPTQHSKGSSVSRSDSGQPRQTYGKARTTYAKERSHLADMVDDLDRLGGTSTQEASQQLASQLATTTGPSQLQLDLEFEDDSDEGPSGSSRIKSIHELRQAGVNNRFDRDLETLLEEIDPETNSSSKSLRIYALMKLIPKMSDDSFTRLFLDRGLSRICRWLPSISDELSSMLIGIALWKSSNAARMSSKISKQIFTAAKHISQILLHEERSLSELSKSRDQNVSKSLSRDIRDFEQNLISDGLLPAYQGSNILPAAVIIGVLNDSLRALAELQDLEVTIPRACYLQLVGLLGKYTEILRDSELASEEIFVAELTLSFLELCTGPIDDDLGLKREQYRDLGESISAMINHSEAQGNDSQSMLRFVLSLSNGRLNVCEVLGGTTLSDAIARIIDKDLLELADEAERGRSIDDRKLNTVILSLGCLLNLSESANSVRQRLSQSTVDNNHSTTYVARFVDIFNRLAQKLSGATNAEQGQVLVAFGYLSMVLCTLSQSSDVRAQVEQQLKGKTFEDIIVEAKTLLIHLTTVQEEQNMAKLEAGDETIDSGAVGNFAQRFGQILSAVTIT